MKASLVLKSSAGDVRKDLVGQFGQVAVALHIRPVAETAKTDSARSLTVRLFASLDGSQSRESWDLPGPSCGVEICFSEDDGNI